MKKAILSLCALCFVLMGAPVVQAQGVEHLSLPSANVTDRPLPPARDGGIYLPHASSGGGLIKAETSARTGKAAKAVKGHKAKAVSNAKSKASKTKKDHTDKKAVSTKKASDAKKVQKPTHSKKK